MDNVTIKDLTQVTLESRYKVFAALSNVPRGPRELVERSGLTSITTIMVLVRLEEDGLARVHHEPTMEWVLNDVA